MVELVEKSLSISLADVKEITRKYLLIKDGAVIDVVIASVVANMLDGDPFWLFLIAPPSSAKTELLRSLAGTSAVHLISTLTPTTLISGMKTKADKEIGLLFRLSDTIALVVKDFGTIMSMRNEQRSEILAQLREVYDGIFTKAFGTGKTIHWEGKLGLVGGATPIIDQYSSVNQALGERFLQYRIKGDDPHEVAKKARESAGRESPMRGELQEAFGGFIDQFSGIQGKSINIKLEVDIEEKIINLACLCARARTAVIRDRYTQAIEVLPESEGPGRLMKQFTNLGIALTLINQKDTLDGEIYKILKRVGKDTLPALRTRMLEVLWREGAYEELGGCWLKTKEIANIANLPTTTAKYKLEDLQSMNLINREIREEDHEDSDKKIPYKWQLSKECVQLLSSTDFLIEENNSKDIPF